MEFKEDNEGGIRSNTARRLNISSTNEHSSNLTWDILDLGWIKDIILTTNFSRLSLYNINTVLNEEEIIEQGGINEILTCESSVSLCLKFDVNSFPFINLLPSIKILESLKRNEEVDHCFQNRPLQPEIILYPTVERSNEEYELLMQLKLFVQDSASANIFVISIVSENRLYQAHLLFRKEIFIDGACSLFWSLLVESGQQRVIQGEVESASEAPTAPSLGFLITLRLLEEQSQENVEAYLSFPSLSCLEDLIRREFHNKNLPQDLKWYIVKPNQLPSRDIENLKEGDIVEVLPTQADGREELENMEIVEDRIIREEPFEVFPSQRLVAKKIFEVSRSTQVLNFDVHSFRSFDFIIFVPKFKSIRQQTIDRLSQFRGLVVDLPEDEIGKKVVIYPYPKESAVVKSFKHKIEKSDLSKDLFAVIVDECHFGPTATYLPFLHDNDLRMRTNVLFLFVSATPYNVLSTQSRIPEGNVIDWMKETNASDIYVGFEYYVRSLGFTLSQGLQLTVNDKALIFSSDKEYANYSAVAADTTEFLKTVAKNLSCEYSKSAFRIKGSTTSISGSILDSMGIVERQIGSLTENNIDEHYPLEMQLIRSDEAFQKLKNVLSNKKNFPHLSRSYLGDDYLENHFEDADGGTMKGKRTRIKRKLLVNFPNKTVYEKIVGSIKWTEFLTLIKKESEQEPADAKTGFIIIIDYILSFCFYAVYKSNGKPGTLLVFNRDLVIAFLECVYQSSFMYFSQNNIGLINLIHEVDFVLDLMIKEKMIELKPRKVNEEEALAQILSEKTEDMSCNRLSKSETWLTETDRIVRLLAEGNTESRAEDNNAPMVLLRCFDSDENESMQHTLRHCLEICNRNCKNIYRRKVDNSGPERPAFSIIGDTSKTRILNEIEKEFLEYKVEHSEFGRCRLGEIPTKRAKALLDKRVSLNEQRKVKIEESLKYEDLKGLPCLLILCEKGRMGDTFPPTLRVLDLRLRTCQNGSGFIQEMGRMCRYPELSTPENPQFAEPGNKEHILKMFTPISKDDKSENDVFSSVDAFPYGCFVFELTNNSVVSLVRSYFQLNLVLNSHKDNSPFQLRKLKHPLPYALIERDYVQALRDALDARETELFEIRAANKDPIAETPIFSASTDVASVDNNTYRIDWTVGSHESSRKMNKILEKVEFSSGLDSYLKRSIKSPGKDFRYELVNRKGHYDIGNNTKDTCATRLLLKAECQIGKTGAFLAFLQLLNQEIEPPAIPPTLWLGDRSHLSRYFWEVPYWKFMKEQPTFVYNFPKLGKYHRKILESRIALFNFVQNDVRQYLSLIRRTEVVISSTGREKLVELSERFEGQEQPNAAPFELINWDGRFDRFRPDFPEFLMSCNGAQTNNAMIFWDKDTLEVDDNDDGQHAGFGYSPRLSSSSFFSAQTLLSAKREVSTELKNYTEEEFCMYFDTTTLENGNPMRIQIKSDQMEKPLKVSLPLNARQYCWNENKETFSNFQPNVISSWIFTPSYAGRSTLFDKYLIRDAVYPGMEPFKDYLEVLVVRSEQFEDYQRHFGNRFVIISLPEKIYYGYNEPVTPATGGCGYSRLFIQLFAELIDLKSVWMVDDNVKSCYEISMGPEEVIDSHHLKYQKTPFSTVMVKTEKILMYSNTENPTAKIDNIPSDCRPIRSLETELPIRHSSHTTSESLISPIPNEIREMHQFTGPNSSYAIIGNCRTLSQQQKKIHHPIKVTYSVYSFFLVNIAAIKKHKVYYPPRPIWEDIEMNHALEEKGLIVCKLQKFAHWKPPHGLRGGTDPEIPVELTALQRVQSYFRGKVNLTPEIHIKEKNYGKLGVNHLVNDFVDPLFPQRADGVEGSSTIFIVNLGSLPYDTNRLFDVLTDPDETESNAADLPSLWFWCNRFHNGDTLGMGGRNWKVSIGYENEKYLIFNDNTNSNNLNSNNDHYKSTVKVLGDNQTLWSFVCVFPPPWLKKKR
jgi:hypothetical protein